LKELDYPAYKIVLVDNGSLHDEGRRLRELFPTVHLILNATNRGFAGGNNDGINWAIANGFDYIVNLNNDCTVEPDWLMRLVDGVSTCGADFGSSMILFYTDRQRICSDGDVLLPDGSAIAIHRSQIYEKSSEPRPIFAACGAGSIYSRRCLEAVKIKDNQYFDELYFAFYEDVDLGLRLNIKSYKGIVVPDAIVYHKHSMTAGCYSEFKMFHSGKNRMLNEIFNYPFYLIPVGELFFMAKLLVTFFYSLFNRQSKGRRYLQNLNVFRLIVVLFKARIWMFANMRTILKNRRERKVKGFIQRHVYRFFNWELGRFAQ
jgi:GT2 family glycosyltransferase